MKLLSLNIEGDNHLERVIPFLKQEEPDVIGMMEVFKDDIPYIEQETGTISVFSPIARIETDVSYRLKPRGLWGVALFAKFPIVNIRRVTYAGKPSSEGIPIWDGQGAWNKVLIAADVEIGELTHRVITTHFTWSAKGLPTEAQRADMDALQKELSRETEFVLCGDFNAPRGGEIWSRLAAHYKDNIPSTIVTTIDNRLHKDGKNNIQLVVDGMFSTSTYTVEDVRVVGGVSDHMAIVCEVTRRD